MPDGLPPRRPPPDEALTEEEVRAIAKEAAKAAVKETFLVLGVDIADPKDVIALQKRLAFLQSFEATTSAAARHSILALTALIVLGIAALIWQRISGGPTP